MSAVDIALLIGALLAALSGRARGLLVGACGLAGFALGVVIARLVAPISAEYLVENEALTPHVGLLTGALAPVVFGALCGAIAASAAKGLRDRTLRALTPQASAPAHAGGGRTAEPEPASAIFAAPPEPRRPAGPGLSRSLRALDGAGGAAASVLAFALVVWLAAGWVRTTPFVEPNRWTADSRIVSVLDALAPVDSADALGTIGRALEDTGVPRVFADDEESIRAVGEPNEAMVAVGRRAEDSVVRIRTTATRCASLQEGTGYVVGEGLVATNAHVVGGSIERIVQVGGRGEPYAAEIVAFDGAKDVAVLRVPGLDAAPLPVGDPLDPDADAVVVGFPEHRSYTISPARVRDRGVVRGRDIRDESDVDREVYSLRAVVRSGNSGGPVLDPQGRVVGMVFARSHDDPETGYALTGAEIADVVEAGAAADGEVDGECAAEV